jgi:6-phosphogluconolactonase (cycloisomerase 2 family)
MITLTQEEQDQLNSHYNGFTIDESKGPHLVESELQAKCHAELLTATGRTAHLFYDLVTDHVYVYTIDPA